VFGFVVGLLLTLRLFAAAPSRNCWEVAGLLVDNFDLPAADHGFFVEWLQYYPFRRDIFLQELIVEESDNVAFVKQLLVDISNAKLCDFCTPDDHLAETLAALDEVMPPKQQQQYNVPIAGDLRPEANFSTCAVDFERAVFIDMLASARQVEQLWLPRMLYFDVAWSSHAIWITSTTNSSFFLQWRDREALLCLESEVQRNPESSEGWRMLGQLYAQLDQDVEAIQCLRKGHEVDPYNLDSLLALGVSCTNELDQLPALKYLRTWLENHEDHQALVEGIEVPPDFEYDAWRRQVTELFQRAAEANPHDADVFVALGVMENINRDFVAAVQALATACRLRPSDPTVWNKLGATLANSGKSEAAVVAYHQGLELKPNYARSWSNMAIAHANLGKHKDAARLYLSSLVLNPEATHIWNFLQSAVLNMNMDSQYALEATEAIEQRDLKAATQIIEGVLDPAKLPKPLDHPTRPPDEILQSIGL
ncbi:PEX5, partial [Symbiodinium necroappetens]